jgi:hypothetical protein
MIIGKNPFGVDFSQETLQELTCGFPALNGRLMQKLTKY